MRKWVFIIINLAIVLTVLTSYKETKKFVDPSALGFIPGEYKDIEQISVDLVYENTLASQELDEVKKAITDMPADVVQKFVSDGWKITVVRDINFDLSDVSDGEKEIVAGLCNYDTKTIQIKIEKDAYYTRTLHELAHYADYAYGMASRTDDFMTLYDKYKGSYVEKEYEGMETDRQIDYASSDRYELFACVMKDYIANPDYLRENYTDLYVYFQNLSAKGVK